MSMPCEQTDCSVIDELAPPINDRRDPGYERSCSITDIEGITGSLLVEYAFGTNQTIRNIETVHSSDPLHRKRGHPPLRCPADYKSAMISGSLSISVFLSETMLFNPDARIRDMSVSILPDLSSFIDQHERNEILSSLVADIRLRLDSRLKGYDDRKCPGSEAILGCLETEGWGSLETSLKALRAILRFNDSILGLEMKTICDIVMRSIRHTNRYAREQGQFCLVEMFRFPSIMSHLCDPQHLLIDGLNDNWSQVRYPSLLALSSFLRESIRVNYVDSVSDELLTHFLINRHFPAEGIRRLSQDVWRMYTGPQGGSYLLTSRLPAILVSLSGLIDSDNHSQREAIVSLTLELTRKLALSLTRDRFRDIWASLIKICIHGLEDEAWFTRLLSAELTSALFSINLSRVCSSSDDLSSSCLERIVDLLMLNSAASFSELRRESNGALRSVLNWCQANDRLGHLFTKLSFLARDWLSIRALERVTSESRCPQDLDQHENRPMYSCGSLMSNRQLKMSSKHSTSDECCSSIAVDHAPESIEIVRALLDIYQLILADPVLGKCEPFAELRTAFKPSIGYISERNDFGDALHDLVCNIASLDEVA